MLVMERRKGPLIQETRRHRRGKRVQTAVDLLEGLTERIAGAVIGPTRRC